MGPKKTIKYKPGSIFWAESVGQGQEEQGMHPWVVISRPSLEPDCGLVIAVPMTSNQLKYNEYTTGVYPSDIDRVEGVEHSLKDGADGTVKCHKLRHWSVEGLGEVVGQVHAPKLEEIRRIAADSFATPRRRKKK